MFHPLAVVAAVAVDAEVDCHVDVVWFFLSFFLFFFLSFIFILSSVHATLQPALSVRPLVGWLLSHSLLFL